MKANFKALTETAKLPTRANDNAAGCDFYADENLLIPAGRSKAVKTGIAWNPTGIIKISDEWRIALIIQSRSGMAFRLGVESSNAGVIDQDYQGEIRVLLYNHSTESIHIKRGDKICQGVPQLIPYFEDVENIKKEERGADGFGSSGVK